MPGMLNRRAGCRRRGLSLAEAALTLVIGALAVTALAEIMERARRASAVQAEARIVSAAAEAAARLAEAEVARLIDSARASPGNARSVPATEIAPALSPDFPAATPLGREIRWAHYAPDADTLIILAWASGDLPWIAAPAGGGGIRRTGRVGDGRSGCPPQRLCGPGLDWDASGLAAGLGSDAPAAGDMAAMRDHSLARIHPDRLWRAAGAGAVNRMRTRLTVAGTLVGTAAITGTARAAVGELASAGGIAASEFRASGSIETRGDLNVRDDLDVDGDITASGTVIAASGRFGSALAPEAQLNVLTSAEMGAVTAAAKPGRAGAGIDDTGHLRAASVTAAGAGTETVRADAVELTGTLSLRAAETGETVVGRTLEARRLTVRGDLYVETCAGC